MTRDLRERELRALMLADFASFIRIYQQASRQEPGTLPPRGSTAEEVIGLILDREFAQEAAPPSVSA
jgi:hypothetical protein